MVEEVVIKISKDTKGVTDTVKELEKLGEVDKKNAEQFKKSNDEYAEAAKKRARIIAEEEANIKELEKAKKKAYSPEDIKLYNDAIKQSKDNISQLKGETEKLSGSSTTLSKSLKKVGIAIVAAFSVKKIIDFTKAVVDSSQTTHDKWEEAMGGMRESTDYFYRAIASGDFSNLIQGLEDAYAAGEKYISMLDLAADMQRAVAITTSALDVELSKARLKARDKTFTAAERVEAVQEYKKLAEERMMLLGNQADFEVEAIMSVAKFRTKLSEQALREIISSVDWQKRINEGTKKERELREAVAKSSQEAGAKAKARFETTFKTYDELFEALTKEERLNINASNAYKDLSDEQRNILKDKLVQQNRANLAYVNGLQEISRVENGIRSELAAAETKRRNEQAARELEAAKLRIEIMSDSASKEQALEDLRYDQYIEKFGESEDALKLHKQKTAEIEQKYRDQQFKLNLEYQNMEQKAREDYQKWIQGKIDKEDKELADAAKEAEKNAKIVEAARKKQIESYFDFVENISDSTFDRIKLNHDAIMSMLDLEIQASERNINTQQSLAERGLANTLSFEQTRLNKLEQQRAEAERKSQERQKREQAAKLVLAFLSDYQQNLDTGVSATVALSNAFKDTLLAKVLGTAISKFEDGGVVGMDGRPVTNGGLIMGARHSSGGVHIEAEGGEGIFSRKEMANFGLNNFYNFKKMLQTPQGITMPTQSNGAILSGLNQMNQTLKAIPLIHTGIDDLGRIVQTEVRNGLRSITVHKKRGVN